VERKHPGIACDLRQRKNQRNDLSSRVCEELGLLLERAVADSYLMGKVPGRTFFRIRLQKGKSKAIARGEGRVIPEKAAFQRLTGMRFRRAILLERDPQKERWGSRSQC